ncbi:hypothetical protein [Lutimonas sp.]|uniref:hypothetical protein n=1 Tax=Lutimonas sp. TaxID=1872403 RepID=UPI003D9B937E
MKKLSRPFLTIGGCIIFMIILGILFIRLQAPEIKLSKSIPAIDKTREAHILTAFFGLDNALPWAAIGLSWNAPGKDGMPVVFSQEVDPKMLEPSDFEITTEKGNTHIPDDVTLLPANEEFELRTVLLIGDYGDHPDNEPVTVKIVGDLTSRSGQNYKGQHIRVIPLEEGPILSYAEYFTFDKDYPYIEKGRGCDCPREDTQMVVRVVWSGGVRALNGDELGRSELNSFEVTMVQGTDTIRVSPYQLADLADNDNNIDVCLKESGIPILVNVNENVAIDPRGDKNPVTKVKVVSRW